MANEHCTSCGNKLSDGDSFCGSCGNQLLPEERPKFCVNCGNTLEAGVEFCGGCGTKIADFTQAGNPDKIPNESTQTDNPPSYSKVYDPPANKKSGPGMVKKSILGIISLVIPIAGFVIAAVYFRKKDKLLGAVYAGLGLLMIIIVSTSGSSDSATAQSSNGQKKDVAVAEPDTPEEIKAKAELIEYEPLYRYIETHVGKIGYFTGEVVQVIKRGDDKYDLRLAMDGDYNQMIYISDYQGVRVLEDDIFHVWGKVDGLHTYKTVLGASRTLPKVKSLVGEIYD